MGAKTGRAVSMSVFQHTDLLGTLVVLAPLGGMERFVFSQNQGVKLKGLYSPKS